MKGNPHIFENMGWAGVSLSYIRLWREVERIEGGTVWWVSSYDTIVKAYEKYKCTSR